jgi:nucleoside-diphosphate-sugar epimerase
MKQNDVLLEPPPTRSEFSSCENGGKVHDGTQYVILGCGYTGRRVAERLLARGLRVVATTRDRKRLRVLEQQGAAVVRVDCDDPSTIPVLQEHIEVGCRVLYSIPPVAAPLWSALAGRASRVVYLSTTGVYGSQRIVDESTTPDLKSPRALPRLAEERAAMAGPWSSLVLRPAAIYGPGRGVHAAMRAGTHRLIGDGGHLVSRIHVYDLAALSDAGLLGDLGGAWPVADDEPCRAREIADFCEKLLGLLLPSEGAWDGKEKRNTGRRVSGRAVREALRVTLQYPSYRTGIPAALKEETNQIR